MHSASITFAIVATTLIRYLGAQCPVQWEHPRVLETPDGRPVYVESPAAAPTKGGIVMLGVPAFIWAEKDAFDPAPGPNGIDTAAYLTRLRANHGFLGFVLDSKRSAIPLRPPVATSIRRPLAVSGIDGTVHVVWLAPAPGSTDPDVDGAVWYTERHGDRWTIPTMIFSADRLDWSGHQAAFVLGPTSDVHLVVPYYRGQTGGIAYIRRTNGRWKATETQLRGLPSQATAQFIGSDSIAVAFAGVGAPGARTPNGQHVYLIRAALSDTIWPTPTLIHWSGLNGVRWLGMYAAPSSRGTRRALTLVWNVMLKDTRTAGDSIYAMASEDAGATWHAPQILALPLAVATMTHASDTRGSVHVFLSFSRRSGPNNGQIYHGAVVNGQWTGLDSVATGPIASAPTLSAIGTDTMLLAWGNARPADRRSQGVMAPVTEYATFSSACPRATRE
jgi:hypothetical protein